MAEKKPQGYGAQEDRPPCQIGHVPGKSSSSCAKAAKEKVDGLVLCDRHALEVKLEGQISCWDEMIFHIDLWSREASRHDRTQIMELLDIERAKANSAMERAHSDLDLLRSETSRGEVSPESAELVRTGSLPPSGARLLSRVLRRR